MYAVPTLALFFLGMLLAIHGLYMVGVLSKNLRYRAFLLRATATRQYICTLRRRAAVVTVGGATELVVALVLLGVFGWLAGLHLLIVVVFVAAFMAVCMIPIATGVIELKMNPVQLQ